MARLDGAGTHVAQALNHAERVHARSGRTGFRGIAQGMAQAVVMLRNIRAQVVALVQSVEKAASPVHETAEASNPEQVKAKLAAAVHDVRAARKGIGAVVTNLAQVSSHIATVLRGGQPGRLLALVDGAKGAVVQAAEQLDSARRKIGEAANEADQIGAAAALVSGPASPKRQGAPPEVASDEAAKPVGAANGGGQEEFDPVPLLAKLPVRVLGRGGGEKTRGTWVDADGKEHPLISGMHEPYFNKALEHAHQLGLVPRPRVLTTAADVELKFAMRMRHKQIRDADIVINNQDGPCPGRRGCDELLPVFLPP